MSDSATWMTYLMTYLMTVGHSNGPVEGFVELLGHNRVRHLVDVRSAPGSRRCPQYNRGTLGSTLSDAGIEYSWIGELGGHRPRQRGVDLDLNAGWNHPSFHNYADYQYTPEFGRGLAELERLAEAGRVAFMCAEAVPWRCHRSILSDVLTFRGHEVDHIMPSGALHRHEPGAWGARPMQMLLLDEVAGPLVCYPAAQPALPLGVSKA